MEGENLCKQLQFLSLLFFQFFQSKKKKKIETLNKKNRSSSWKETKVSFPARIESVVDGKVGRASNVRSGNIFTRVIDRPPVESPGTNLQPRCTCVSRFEMFCTCVNTRDVAMSRIDPVDEGCNLSLSLQPSRSSPLGPNRDAHASILPRRVSRNGAPPPSTSLNQFSSNHDRFHRFDGRIWRGWAANKSKDAVTSFRNASIERRSRRKLDQEGKEGFGRDSGSLYFRETNFSFAESGTGINGTRVKKREELVDE